MVQTSASLAMSLNRAVRMTVGQGDAADEDIKQVRSQRTEVHQGRGQPLR